MTTTSFDRRLLIIVFAPKKIKSAPMPSSLEILFFLMISSVFGLEYKVSIDIDLVKTNQVLNTFYPNKIDDPIKVNAKKDPTLNLKGRKP